MKLRIHCSPSQSGFTSVEAIVAQSSLPDDEWHSIIISISGTSARFYTDGSLQVERTLVSSSIKDGEGVLSIGGLSESQFYTGHLQDVRIYSTSLTQE